MENINPHYNPFDPEKSSPDYKPGGYSPRQENLLHWESLYSDLKRAEKTITEALQESTEMHGRPSALFQFKQKYILLALKSGLMMIDQKRAHERILYERNLEGLKQKLPVAQQELFPRKLILDAGDHALIMGIFNDICALGFDIRDAGEHSIEIKGVPAYMDNVDPEEWIQQFISDFKEREADIKEETEQKVAAAIAKSSAIRAGKVLQQEEMREIIDQLFACTEPGIAPDGKAVFRILPVEDIEKMFN